MESMYKHLFIFNFKVRPDSTRRHTHVTVEEHSSADYNGYVSRTLLFRVFFSIFYSEENAYLGQSVTVPDNEGTANPEVSSFSHVFPRTALNLFT